jgi:hypothetical protein
MAIGIVIKYDYKELVFCMEVQQYYFVNILLPFNTACSALPFAVEITSHMLSIHNLNIAKHTFDISKKIWISEA